MVDPYCFAERTYELFTEACARGWLAGVRDWPQFKTREESAMQAQQESDALLPEVCCIHDLEKYRLLFNSAWMSAYRALDGPTDRERTVMKSFLVHMPVNEALDFLRYHFSSEEGQVEIRSAYAQFLEQTGD